MIRDYSNHAANERTFLAWVRTGIAVIALGFVIEKFNLFLVTVAKTLAAEGPYPIQLHRLSGALGRYGGVALVLGGVALIVIAASRFIRTERLLDAEETHPASALRVEFALLIATVLFVAGFSVYVALG
jgi:putative membrane protein